LYQGGRFRPGGGYFAAAGQTGYFYSVRGFLLKLKDFPSQRRGQLLRNCLTAESTRTKRNLVQSLIFESGTSHQGVNALETRAGYRVDRAGQDMREANCRGEDLRLSDDELAFYDALGTNDAQ
jgi:type I restriction enzyme R subunit